ncbi:MAG TPA: N-acetylmuramoyl-L-alanine amidase [Anaerolineae bacterium]|nr:N-acetylmuramoyl-L-alanine amidase [Anaerolineae bacterium]
MYSYRPEPNQTTRRTAPGRSQQTMFSLAIITLVIMGVLMGFKLFSSEVKREITIAQPESEQVGPLLAPTVSVAANPLPTRDPFRPLVGIVSGHRGYDPGAVCADGLTEAEVNYRAALEAIDLLERRGVQAVLLEEFDERLTGFQADALVSIHADSCMVPGATGFKVARVTDSAIPEAEDRLVACLYQEYEAYTGLPQHPSSITDNMTNYHAFREIDRSTPGAIIELGFLLDDRYLLENKPKILARGVAAGILCFLGK